MRKYLFILPLLTTALLTAYAQTPLNRLDSLYFDGDVEAASVYAEKVLNDPNHTATYRLFCSSVSLLFLSFNHAEQSQLQTDRAADQHAFRLR